MSGETSPSTGKLYGLERVCRLGGFARSTFYARRSRAAAAAARAEGTAEGPAPSARRRGPVPSVSDERLDDAIRADLAASPFVGEGHRKVWARLHRSGLAVGCKRVLRRMRVLRLLSPHRRPKGPAKAHDGSLQTARPDVMWATDGAQVETAREGRVWLFVAVDHHHGECVGAHVSASGDRFAAMEPVRQGVRRHFGALSAAVAQGLSVHSDHGSQYTSSWFRTELRFLGITPSLALVGEPETNGIAERFIRTLKEQVVHGRVFETVEALRRAVEDFVARYNAHWRLQKNGFRSPDEVRADFNTAHLAKAA